MKRMKSLLVVVSAIALVGAGEAPPVTKKVTRVHVKKSARTMELFAGDDLVSTWSVAVGRGGSGPKKMEGDNVTPVGRYHVVKHMPSHLRIFMLIDYPNADDRARFEEAKKKGELPKNANIGGDIGIHGEPPEAKPFKKADYQSHGCVVLEDAEIDQVARAVPDGTPVDIED
jgi:murein L,D-transpeptidase YafK